MSSFFFNPSRAYLPSNEFLDYCHIGFINAPRDIDGVVRRLPLVRGLRYSYINPTDGKKIERKIMLPSIALNACLAYYGINLIDLQEMSPKELTNAPLRIVMGDAIYLRKASNADYTRIPIDEKGNMVLDYHGRISHYNQMSLLHAFDHEIAKLNLNNKLAMVGMTATGNVDMGPTPVSELSPFVLVHLTAIANIINETFIYELTHTNKLMWCLLIWFFFICGTVWLSNRNLSGISVLFFINAGFSTPFQS